MNSENIITPVKMEYIRDFLKEIHKKADVYKYCGARPPHMLIYLDAGNGQTTLTEYITDNFVQGKMCHFGGVNDYLEYNLNGSMVQLKKICADIESNAVYMNKFHGVIAFNIGALSTKYNEPQIPYFVDMVDNLRDSATLIFYVPTITNRTLDNLIRDVKHTMDNIVTMTIPDYSTSDLAEIAKRSIENMGVHIEFSKKNDAIEKLIADKHITMAKEAAMLGKRLAQYADLRESYPVIRLEKIKLKDMDSTVSGGKINVK